MTLELDVIAVIHGVSGVLILVGIGEHLLVYGGSKKEFRQIEVFLPIF